MPTFRCATDHFRYFAGCIRAEEGAMGEIDNDTVAYHFKEPLGVVGQIIPWNFPLLMAAWKLAPALGAGNCTVIKPASNTPLSLLVLMDLIGDLLPPGVLNVVSARLGRSARRWHEPAHRQDRVHRRDHDGPPDHAICARSRSFPRRWNSAASRPNIFFADVMDEDDDVPRQGAGRLRAVRLQQGRSLHLPFARLDPGVDFRQVHGEGRGPRRQDQGRRSARSEEP